MNFKKAASHVKTIKEMIIDGENAEYTRALRLLNVEVETEIQAVDAKYVLLLR